MALVREACAAGARLDAVCAVLGVSARTPQRWTEQGGVQADGRQAAARERTPANKLGVAERQDILAVVNRPEFAGLPPSQIVPRLADQGEYLASDPASTVSCAKPANWPIVARPRPRAAAVRLPGSPAAGCD